jgi:RecB family endonuclease NucS
MEYLIKPAPHEALKVLKKDRQHEKRMVIIIGCCQVEYDGRARSSLDYGDRLVIIKADGTLMVHGNEKREPLNWQPPGARIRYEDDDGITIEAERISPMEVVRIRFAGIQAMGVFHLEDDATLKLVGSEGDIVDRIIDDPSIIEPGLEVLEREKMTCSGFIDLFCKDADGNSVIIEVKRRCVSSPAVRQLEAYLYDFRKENKKKRVRGILCAPRISKLAKMLVEEKGLEFKELGRDVVHKHGTS